MVGVPTSNRCDNCRKRKKKCSEQKPSCSECIRAGWVCPGYKNQWKFIDETSRLAQQYAGRKYVYDDSSLNPEDDDMALDKSVRAWKILPFSRSPGNKTDAIYPGYRVPRILETNSLGSELVYCLDTKVTGILIPLRVVGTFFDFIPARLGYNVALDDAVSCLCSIYYGTSSSSYSFDRHICQKYVRALSSLRGCLSDTSVRMESETLCASILLQMCELVISVDRGGWNQLARGTAFLLYSRGAHRYENAFDHTMLESQLGYVVSQSMRLKEHCFLRSSEWQALLMHSSIWRSTTVQSRALSLRSELCGILVDLPSLIIDYSRADENKASTERWEESSSVLMHEASVMLDKLIKWLKTEAEPLFIFSSPSQHIIQEHVNYPDVISAILDCVANTALLTLHKMLRPLCHVKLQSSNFAGRNTHQQAESSLLLNDSETVERWRRRAITAFKFVQNESTLAAKPLAFGLQQIQSGGPSFSVGE